MKKVNYLISLALFLAINCFAQELPKTNAGKRTKEVIEILNGTSSYELDDYINNQFAPRFRDAFPLDAHKGMIKQTQSMFGKVEVIEIKKTTPNEISIVLKSKMKDAWLNLTLLVEQDTPHRILMLGFRPTSRPVDSGDGKVDAFSSLEGLNQYLLKKSKENEFSGAVLIAKEGIPIFQDAYGYASKKAKVKNEIDTKFNLGSINKIFTTVAITQLMEKGELSLEDPIGKYLDFFPREIADKVTIRHLLNMRSGWGDYWSNKYYLAHKDELKTVSDYMGFIKNIPLDFEPGSSFQHCNIGYEVAGAIIEKVSGMDYYDYIKKNIYNKAGMTDSGSYFGEAPVENLAIGYVNQSDNKDILPLRGTPAGGGYSTVEDLLKFDKALRNHTLLNPEYTRYLINRFEGFPNDKNTEPNKMYSAEGRAPGIISYVGMDLKTSYTVIMLSNCDNSVAMDLPDKIIKMLDIE